MLQRLIANALVSPPALWGKLRGHADFVRSGVRHGEIEGWQPWLARHAGMAALDLKSALPVAFVLPPGTLAFAPGHFVLGVITPSADRSGRRHALLVYQRAHPAWMRGHFEAHARQPRDWLFWLALAVARHTGERGTAELRPLERSVQGLWHLHAPGWRELVARRPRRELSESECLGAMALLDRTAGPASPDDPAQYLGGARYHVPWADWPARLLHDEADCVFWLQDAHGGFFHAANRLTDLWSIAR